MSNLRRFTLRIDAQILEEIEERAKNNKRSMAKEIEYILENYLKEHRSDNEG